MFGFFKKKSQQEIEFEVVLKTIKQSAKEINKHNGKYVEVCLEFMKFAKDDELYKDIGLIWDKYVPHNKVHVAHASLMLLAALKTGRIDKSKEDFLQILAKFAFENSVFIMSSEEMQPLVADSDLLVDRKNELKKSSTDMWNDWDNTDLKLLRLVAQL